MGAAPTTPVEGRTGRELELWRMEAAAAEADAAKLMASLRAAEAAAQLRAEEATHDEARHLEGLRLHEGDDDLRGQRTPESAGEEGRGEEEEEEEASDDGESSGGALENDPTLEIVTDNFTDLVLPDEMVGEVSAMWSLFLASFDTREAAGEALYSTFFDTAPSLRALFKTPRAIQAVKFINGLDAIVGALGDPKALKAVVESQAFQHLEREVTLPRVVLFRDAIIDMIHAELGDRVSPAAHQGLIGMLNYAGGAYIFVRDHYAERLRLLAHSWASANKRATEDEEEAASAGESDGAGPKDSQKVTPTVREKAKASVWTRLVVHGGKDSEHHAPTHPTSPSGKSRSSVGSNGGSDTMFRNTSVPTTFNEMFRFNMAVMGFNECTWMREVLSSFDNIVQHIGNVSRLQEECDVVALRLAKHKGPIILSDYKAVTMASLRSIVPQRWNSEHETAWGWLWENVEGIIKEQMGKPAAQHKALENFYSRLTPEEMVHFRREAFETFFTLAPDGQDHFKTSGSRLHFIADKIMAMTLEMYKTPSKLVEDISALGLRHAAFGIPTDLPGPFVTAFVQVVRTMTTDAKVAAAFGWSLSLISRILVRTISEGSTIVMKAIHANSAKQLRKAAGCAPRGKRALWMLDITVGSQSISPLMCAIESSSLEAARAILVDLLTIRADRENYYFGAEALFKRHPDIIKTIATEAPSLLPDLLDHLVWRSHVTQQAHRRVNYYVRYLLIGPNGGFSDALRRIAESQNPRIFRHPVLEFVAELVWRKLALRTFLFGKLSFLVGLVVLLLGESLLPDVAESDGTMGMRTAVLICRAYTYMITLPRNLITQTKAVLGDYRSGRTASFYGLRLPESTTNSYDLLGYLLTVCLIAMLGMEPIIFCVQSGGELFSEHCEAANEVRTSYNVFSMLAVILYMLLLSELSVLSTQLAAYALACRRVASQFLMFLLILIYLTFMFSCAVNAWHPGVSEFEHAAGGTFNFLEIALNIYYAYDRLQDDAVLVVLVMIYLALVTLFFSNLLIAQLTVAYTVMSDDMEGFAKMYRAEVIVETMEQVSPQRWSRFVESLGLSSPLEFNEGDVGFAGGIQVKEPAIAHVITADTIRRFGGSTSAAARWPEDDGAQEEDGDRLERMERLLKKAMSRMSHGHGKNYSATSMSVSSAMRSMSSSGSTGSVQSESHCNH